MKKILFLILLPLLITGCQQKKETIYYIHHSSQLKSALESCEAKGADAVNDEECQKVVGIYQQLVNMSEEFLSDPAAFGNKIIINQQKLNQLDPQSEAYKTLKKETEVMVAMVGQAEAPEGF